MLLPDCALIFLSPLSSVAVIAVVVAVVAFVVVAVVVEVADAAFMKTVFIAEAVFISSAYKKESNY